MRCYVSVRGSGMMDWRSGFGNGLLLVQWIWRYGSLRVRVFLQELTRGSWSIVRRDELWDKRLR